MHTYFPQMTDTLYQNWTALPQNQQNFYLYINANSWFKEEKKFQ